MNHFKFDLVPLLLLDLPLDLPIGKPPPQSGPLVGVGRVSRPDVLNFVFYSLLETLDDLKLLLLYDSVLCRLPKQAPLIPFADRRWLQLCLCLR